MCGIAGEISFGRRQVDPSNVKKMCDLLTHRGPDESGYHFSTHVALGIRRLRIIDFSDGAQPAFDKDRSLVCVFNGEIYNHQALKNDLKADSEAGIIVNLYDRYGLKFVEHLDGMFAIAIYDVRKNVLILARDRAGKKPLNYVELPDGSVAFSSELTSLISHPRVKRKISYEAVDRYLSFRIIPAPLTIFENIFKVEPGSVVTFNGVDKTNEKYWKFDFTPKTHHLTLNEIEAEIEKKLCDAVSTRLKSEVPLGAVLSGGLDSSLVVAIMAKLSNKKFHTFSIGFEDENFNELGYAKKVSDFVGTFHHEYVIKCEDVLRSIKKIILHVGEPFAFPSIIASYYMYWLARQYVTVVLGGDGADEIFCGYNRYKIFNAFPLLPTEDKALSKVDIELLNDSNGDISNEYRAVSTDGMRDSLKRDLYSKDFIKKIPGVFPVNYMKNKFANNSALQHKLDRAMDVDCNFWLNDAQLVKIDIASMANSVELRSPMLDKKLVEFVCGVGIEHKLYNGEEKYILKRIAAKYLPKEVVFRRKQELAVPLENWLSRSLKNEMKSALLSEESFSRNYFEADKLKKFVGNYKTGDSYVIWTLYIMELWHRTLGI